MQGELLNKFLENQEKMEREKKTTQDFDKKEIVLVDINLLDNFKNHIFSPIGEIQYNDLKDSISRYGVLSPIIIRKKENNRYEIISGHNRCECCKELNVEKIPAIIKDYDDDTAELVMIESNLTQREKILPCEKGLAYKIRGELLKKLNIKNPYEDTDTNDLEKSTPMEYKGRIVEQLAEEFGDSKSTVQRYIHLTRLNEDLKQKVNNGEIGIRVGEIISYLNPEEQDLLNNFINEEKVDLTEKKAKVIKKKSGLLTRDILSEIVEGKVKTYNKKKQEGFTGRIHKEIINKYKDKFKNDEDFNELILFLLKKYYESQSDN